HAGPQALQRGRVHASPHRLPHHPHRRREISREVAAARRMEGDAVQHLLRRHLQRAAARVGAALRLAPAGLLHQMRVVKAHAFGNDFLLVEESEIADGIDRPALARECGERHRGLGADGLIVSAVAAGTCVRMALLNADGSYSEVSGNGVRGLAAWIAKSRGLRAGESVAVETDAGVKTLELLAIDGRRYTFRSAVGHAEEVPRRP